VADTRPGGTLARTYEGKPGLPRGRNGLPLRAVWASHRERLLRSVIAAVADDPAFAKVIYMDMPGAGPLAADRIDAAGTRIADLNRKWHERARTRHPEWPPVPGEAYLARFRASTVRHG
jgi:hypothetical protein